MPVDLHDPRSAGGCDRVSRNGAICTGPNLRGQLRTLSNRKIGVKKRLFYGGSVYGVLKTYGVAGVAGCEEHYCVEDFVLSLFKIAEAREFTGVCSKNSPYYLLFIKIYIQPPNAPFSCHPLYRGSMRAPPCVRACARAYVYSFWQIINNDPFFEPQPQQQQHLQTS